MARSCSPAAPINSQGKRATPVCAASRAWSSVPAVRDGGVAACRRRFEHAHLDPACQLLHFVNDLVDARLGLVAGVPPVEQGGVLCEVPWAEFHPDRHTLQVPVGGPPAEGLSDVVVQPYPHVVRPELINQGRRRAGDRTIRVLDHHDDDLDRRQRRRQDEPEVVAVAHDQSAQHPCRRAP